MGDQEKKTERTAPPAKHEFYKVTQHGETRIDLYHWLRGQGMDDWKQVLQDPPVLDPDIRAHLEAENAYYEDHAKDFAALTQQIGDELAGRLIPDESSVPLPHDDWEYWRAYRDGGDYPVFMRRNLQDGAEHVLFDGDKERGESKFFDLGGIAHSPDHKYVAYGLDREGSEYFNVRFRDIETGKELPETLPMTSGGFVWSENSAQLYYIECDDHHRPKRVKCHVLGTDVADDHLVYEEPDDGFFLGLGKSQSDDYIYIHSAGKETSEVRYLDSSAAPDAEPVLIREREKGVEYDVDHHGDYFYIHTNDDGATEYKIMRAPVDDCGKENWTEIVPHNENVTIAGMIILKDFMIRMERERALPRIIVSDYNGQEYSIDFPDEAYTVSAAAGYEFDDDKIRLHYSSPSRPGVTYEFDLNTREKTVLKERKLPNGHDPDEYIVERKFIEARDGTDVPVTILRHKSTPCDGSAPLFQYGYGSYGISMDASFSSNAISLVDRGAIYAVAHIRGGGDMGKQWYLDGKKEHKLNTFHDFIDVTEALTDQGYGRKGHVAIEGGSAGGMLMGAVSNMRPDLYMTVVAGVPFVDVLNTISDPSLPLTPPEWEEWGNPIEDRDAYDTIKSYSPYDNIQDGVTYPAILATSGLTDYRVTYWEPAKWIARLREKAEGGPFFSKVKMNSGHSGSAARYEMVRERAEDFAFVIDRFEKAGYDMSLRVDYSAKKSQARPDNKQAPGGANNGPT